MASERYGHRYLFSDGTVSLGRNPERGYLVETYVQENDGASFLSRGSEKEVIVRIARVVAKSDVQEALAKSNNFNGYARDLLDEWCDSDSEETVLRKNC